VPFSKLEEPTNTFDNVVRAKNWEITLSKRDLTNPPSVLHNGILIDRRNIANLWATHCVCIAVVNDDPSFPVSIRGSGTLLRLRDRYYMVCCFHQINDVSDLSKVGVFFENNALVTTSGGARQFKERGATELQDLVIFDYTGPIERNPAWRSLFFNCEPLSFHPLPAEIVVLQVFGYPTSLQKYKLWEDEPSLGFTEVIIPYRIQRASHDPSALVLRPIGGPLEYDPDGLSGGAAFTIVWADGTPSSHIAGIVTRATSNDLYLLKADAIRHIFSL
jgi:hypothetical protein